MMFTIDIDTGGTFTDGFFTKGIEAKWVKVDTTPHDLAVCLMECIREGARVFDLEMEDMLHQTNVIRYSTTIGTNSLIQKIGPKLGIIVTKGFENTLYASIQSRVDVSGDFPKYLESFVQPQMIIGLEEEIDNSGNVLCPLDDEEIRQAMECLLESGARTIVISLRNSYFNAVHEQRAKNIIESEYPRHYLGSVPVLLSSEVTTRTNDHLRANVVILSAYLRQDMVRFLYRADEELHKTGYTKPLLVTHSTGGVARVAKTTAIDTYNAGPTSGLMGCSLIAKELYGIEDFVSIDVGGTSIDVGVVTDAKPSLSLQPRIEEIPVNIPLIEILSLGGGGGAIAKVQIESGTIIVGPESAGAMPGPASYDLGGTKATVTDADLVLGFLDPDYFLGGIKKLNRERAFTAIQDQIAAPLGITVEQAAYKIVQAVEEETAKRIRRYIEESKLEIGKIGLFVFGGAGGTRCCRYASYLGMHRVMVFAFNAVASAVGSSLLDVLHIYESPIGYTLRSSSGSYLAKNKYEEFNAIVRHQQSAALRDMRGEGFSAENISYRLELELWGNLGGRILEAPFLYLESEDPIKSICKSYDRQSSVAPVQGEIRAEAFRLSARCPTPHYQFPKLEPAEADSSKAFKGKREVYWGENYVPTVIFEQELLDCGNQVEGPAIIESRNTTCVVPPGWKYIVDSYLNGLLEETGR
ncbi:hydantoinase/oxoprolinase family protein [Chloroflexota bacterium]